MNTVKMNGTVTQGVQQDNEVPLLSCVVVPQCAESANELRLSPTHSEQQFFHSLLNKTNLEVRYDK